MSSTHLRVASLNRGSFKTISFDGTLLSEYRAEPPYAMNGTQLEVFNTRRNRKNCIVVQPPGSGKSLLICFLNAWDLSQNKAQKVIISLPQNLIAKGFKDVLLKFPDGRVIQWAVGNDFCGIGEQKVHGLVQFIQRTKFPLNLLTNSIADRIALCSHAGLAQAYGKLNNRRNLWANTTLVIDEAHHILNAEDNEESLNLTERNQLGELIHFLLKRPIEGNKLWMTTATFFRGDRMSILTATEKKLFSGLGTYYLPLDVHWEKNIKHIQGYQFDFYMYGEKGPIEAISKILINGGRRRTIVYCQDARQLDGECKYANLKRLIKLFKHHWGDDIVTLDFLTEEGREERKAAFVSQAKQKGHREPDVIFAVRLMDEGTDWVPAEQVIDLAPSNSLRVGYQRVGRVIRDTPNKANKVMLYNVLLSTPSKQIKRDKEAFQKKCNLNLAALHMVALIESEFEFIPLKGIDDTLPRSKGETGAPRTWFQKKFPETTKQVEVLGRAAVVLTLARAEGKEDHQGVQLVEDMLREEYNVKDHITEVAIRVIAIIDRSEKKNKSQRMFSGLNVGPIVDGGFRPVKGTEFLDDLWVYTSGVCGVGTMKEWREMHRGEREAEWNNNFEYAHHLFKTKGSSYESVNTKHGIWQFTQRQWYKMGKLTLHREKKLRSIDFVWVAKNFLPYKEAKELIIKLKIKGQHEYQQRKPSGIPSHPQSVYSKEWEGWSIFLGTFPKPSIKIIRRYIKNNNIKSLSHYISLPKIVKKKNSLPLALRDFCYRNGIRKPTTLFS